MTCDQQRFERDVADHVMTIVRDDGVDRHIKFRDKDGGSPYWFEILTWPGALCIRGDCGTYVFSRLTDMFEFFRAKRQDADPNKLYINASYWMEKIIAVDSNCGQRGEAKKFSVDTFKRRAVEWFRQHTSEESGYRAHKDRWRIWERLREIIEYELDDYDSSGCYRKLYEFEVWNSDKREYDCKNFFDDFWEIDATEYDFHFIWNLYAIAWAIRQYDAAKAEKHAA